jgi:hypothetical protein
MGTHFMGGLNMRTVAVTDAATYSFKVKNSGKMHLIPNLTADCTMTLPAVEDGLKFELMYAGAAADAQDWIIVTSATTQLFKGGVVHLDHDADDAGDEVVPVFADFSNDDTFTVLTPSAGTFVTLVSDGTSWLVTGSVVSASAPTFA